MAAVLVRGHIAMILCGLAYYTGAAVLKIFSLGRLRLAPLSTFDERNRRKPVQRWDWSIWLRKSGHGRMLKAECVVVMGFLTWASAGGIAFLAIR